MQRQKIKNKITRGKSAKKRAVLAYEQEVKIPIAIGIPIKVVMTKKSDLRSPAWLYLRHLSKQFLKAVSVSILIFAFVAQAVPFGAFEAHVINVTAKICNGSQTRTMGYWKNHPEVYDPDLLPQILGNDEVNSQEDVNAVFDANNSVMRNKLKKQLLAMEFNVAAFGIGGYIDPTAGGLTIDEIIAEANDLLINGGTNDEMEAIKDLLDYLNNLHLIKFCGNGSGQGGPEEPGKILINKVYYDVDSTHGKETKKEWNEWVELYNPSDAPVNVSDWVIEDNDSSDTLASTSPIIIPALGFAIVTGADSTFNYWAVPPDVIKIILSDGKIGNGLANDGDRVILKDTDGNIVDMMSYGLDTFAFDPSVALAPEGDMLARFPNGADTDTAADWRDFSASEVTVQIPNGGEKWYVGRTYELNWSAENPNGDNDELLVDIYYSADSGQTWANIVKGTENDGSFDWKIPLLIDGYLTVSSHARIKVVATGPENFMVQGQDMSDRDFCPPVDYSLLSDEEKIMLEELVAQGIIDPSEIINEEPQNIDAGVSTAPEITEQPVTANTSSTEDISDTAASQPADISSDTGGSNPAPEISEPQPAPAEENINLEPPTQDATSTIEESQDSNIEENVAPEEDIINSSPVENNSDDQTKISPDEQPVIEPTPAIEQPQLTISIGTGGDGTGADDLGDGGGSE